MIKNKKDKADSVRRQQQAARLGKVIQVYRLLKQKKFTISQIAKLMDCSERTIHRYMDVLEYIGVKHSFSDGNLVGTRDSLE